MTVPPVETPHLTIRRLATGHFRQGPGYSAFRSRGTDDFLLIYTIRGAGRFGYQVGAEVREVLAEPGDVILLRPGTPHDYGVEPRLQRWELLWTHFHPRPEWHAWFDWPLVAPEALGLMRLSLVNPIRRRVRHALARMHRRAMSPLRLRETLAMNALEEALLWCEHANPRGDTDLDPRIGDAMEYLCRHLAEKLQLDDIAAAVGLSVSRLSHLFREQAGTTPQRFLELQRLDRAKQLLELTQLPIHQVAAEVGFDNPFYFTLRFKRHTGESPRAYRARARSEGDPPVGMPPVRV